MEDLRGSYSSYVIGGVVIGAIIGGIVFFLLGVSLFYATGPLGFLVGAALGASVGAAIGLVSRAIPPAAAGFLLTAVILTVVVGTSVMSVRFYNLGILPAYSQPLVKIPADAAKLASAGMSCLSSEEGFSACVAPIMRGWDSETKAEVVAVKLKYITTDIFYDGKDKEVEAQLVVTNEPQEGEQGIDKFYLEPECYVDDTKVDSEVFGEKEGGKLTFIQLPKTQQIATVKCIVPESLLKGKTKTNVNIKITRPVLASVEWNAITQEKEAYFEEVKENAIETGKRGASVKYAGVPYELGIGIGHNLPLTEGEWKDFYAELSQKTLGEGKLKEINFIKVSGDGETASIDSCEGFSKEGDEFIIKDIAGKDIESYEKGKRFSCVLSVEPEENKNNVIFRAQASFSVETEHKTSIPIFSSA